MGAGRHGQPGLLARPQTGSAEVAVRYGFAPAAVRPQRTGELSAPARTMKLSPVTVLHAVCTYFILTRFQKIKNFTDYVNLYA